MTANDDVKPLSAWRLELKKFDKKHWLRYYKEMLGAGVSNTPRFYKALALYGSNCMFEAISAAAMNEISGDPFFYVMKVAANKWKEIEEAKDTEIEYENKIKRSIEESQKHIEELARKLGK